MKRLAYPAVGIMVTACVLLGATAGCTTYQDQRTRQAMQEREDVLLVQEDIRRLSGRVEGLELELERLHRELASQRDEQERFVNTQVQGTETRLSGLERRIQEVDNAREKDKKEIVDRLSSTMAEMMRNQQQATRQQAQARTTHSGYGYEHTVAAGETLSHIASAYGVTTRVIVDANKLENPDRLRVGQKLFIPE